LKRSGNAKEVKIGERDSGEKKDAW
jgi:hypothetical protein